MEFLRNASLLTLASSLIACEFILGPNTPNTQKEQAAFERAYATCAADDSACQTECFQKSYKPSCRAFAVFVASNPTKLGQLDSQQLSKLKDEAFIACKGGVDKACTAADKLQSEGLVFQEDTPHQFSITEVSQLQRRIDDLGRRFDEAKLFPGKIPEGAQEDINTATAILDEMRSALSRASKSAVHSTSYFKKLDEADKVISTLEAKYRIEKDANDKQLAIAEATRKAEANTRKEEQNRTLALKEAHLAYLAAKPRCGMPNEGEGKPTKECIDNCAKDPKSADCVALGIWYGDHGDETKGLKVLRRGCEVGNLAACQGVKTAEEVVAEKAAKKKAEASLPGLFTKCEANRAKVAAIKQEGRTAARNRDAEGAQRATEKLQDFEPIWSGTLEQLKATIELVSEPGSDRRMQLYKDVKRRCSLLASPTVLLGVEQLQPNLPQIGAIHDNFKILWRQSCAKS